MFIQIFARDTVVETKYFDTLEDAKASLYRSECFGIGIYDTEKKVLHVEKHNVAGFVPKSIQAYSEYSESYSLSP